MSTKETLARQALRAHAKDRAALDRKQVQVVKAAKQAGITMEEIAETLGISLRTAYNRLEGKAPRIGATWRE